MKYLPDYHGPMQYILMQQAPEQIRSRYLKSKVYSFTARLLLPRCSMNRKQAANTDQESAATKQVNDLRPLYSAGRVRVKATS